MALEVGMVFRAAEIRHGWLRELSARVRRARPDEGVGLVEVLVGLAVLSITSVPVASLMGTSMESVATSQQRILAAQLASEAIQQVEALPYADVAKGMNPSELEAGGDPLVSPSGEGGWVYLPTGAPIVADSEATYEPPLVPYRHTVYEDGTSFTVAVYTTQYPGQGAEQDGVGFGGLQGMTALAVWVSWKGAGGAAGTSEEVTASTTVYSPGQVATAGTSATAGASPAPAPGGSPGPPPPGPGGVENDCGEHQESLLASPSAEALPGAVVSIYYLDDTAFTTAEVLVNSVEDQSVTVSASSVSPGSVELSAVDTCGGSPPNPDQPEGYQLEGSSSGSGSGSSSGAGAGSGSAAGAEANGTPGSGGAPSGGRAGYEEELSFTVPSGLAAGSTLTIRVHDGDGDYDSYTWTVASQSGSQ